MSHLSFRRILNAFRQGSSKYETVHTSKMCVLVNLLDIPLHSFVCIPFPSTPFRQYFSKILYTSAGKVHQSMMSFVFGHHRRKGNKTATRVLDLFWKLDEMASRKTAQQYHRLYPNHVHCAGMAFSFYCRFSTGKQGLVTFLKEVVKLNFFFLCGCTNGKNMGEAVPIVEKLLRDLH